MFTLKKLLIVTINFLVVQHLTPVGIAIIKTTKKLFHYNSMLMNGGPLKQRWC